MSSCSYTDLNNLLDTLDLQDHDEPSAKDHTKQPEAPAPLGGGRPAPHQEMSIRHAQEDSKAEIMGGPGPDGREMYEDGDEMDDDLGSNGHYDHEEGDLADGESDDLLDDDLMDKISSSPSIDDGKVPGKSNDTGGSYLISSRGYRL